MKSRSTHVDVTATPAPRSLKKPLIGTAMLLLLGVLQVVSAQVYQSAEEVAFGLFDDHGDIEVQDLSDFTGKIVVLYYYTPW